jgi:hypothetical protein
MRYALDCAVESKVVFRQKSTVSWGKKTVYFERDDATGILNRIRIEGPVADDDKITARIETLPNGMTRLNETGGGRVHRELVADLQSLESVFAYYYNLSRIHWESPTRIIIPETPEEEVQIEFNNTKYSHQPPDPTMEVDLDTFPMMVQFSLKCKHLASPLAFHREGGTDMKNMRYITAYFSYYFVLEGLYANGKWKSDAVKAEFKRSRILKNAIQQCIDHGFPKPSMGHIYTVESLLASKGKKVTPDNMIWLLVETRGDLHHFVNSPTKPSGTPFTHDRYEVLALIIGKISHLVLLEEIKKSLPPG